MSRARVAILISGRGSNMSALIADAARPDHPGEIVLVLSDRPGAGGLAKAAEAGIATDVVEFKTFADRTAFEAALDARLRAAAPDVVCLAGFMRLLSEDFVQRWRDRMINIHPSILPAFTGLNTHARALDMGVRIHGCTVHFVRAAMDDGPIVAQAAVPVLADDTPHSLAARVLKAEHRIYPLALRLVAGGKVRVAAEKVVFSGLDEDTEAAALVSPPLL